MATPKKKPDGFWHVDIRPTGRGGPRLRKKFTSKGEANQFIQHCAALAADNKPWIPKSQDDKRLFTELVDLWFDSRGIHLSDGERRARACKNFAAFLGGPIAKNITPSDFYAYTTSRKKEGIADKTINNIRGYVDSVYNHLHKSKIIDYQSPLLNVDAIKIPERELSYLSMAEIKHLLETIENFNKNPHVLIITKICLATGARWGEAESLKKRNVRENKVTFVDTKNKKSRSIPIDENLFNEIHAHFKVHGEFNGSTISSFRRALVKSGIKDDLPAGQAAHVLRHTFASWFMINGGNILTLQRILDHSTLNMTMRYAHLAPDHLKESIELNPLTKLSTA